MESSIPAGPSPHPIEGGAGPDARAGAANAAFLTRDLLGRAAVRGLVVGGSAALVEFRGEWAVVCLVGGCVAPVTLLAGWSRLARRPLVQGAVLSAAAVGWITLVVAHAGAQRAAWSDGPAEVFKGAHDAVRFLLDVDGLNGMSRSLGVLRWVAAVCWGGCVALGVTLRDRRRGWDVPALLLGPGLGVVLCGYLGLVARVLLSDAAGLAGTPFVDASVGGVLVALVPSLLVFGLLYPAVAAPLIPLYGLLALADRLAQALGVAGPRPEQED